MDIKKIDITLDKDKVERIAIETIRVLKNRFEKLPANNDILRNMPFHTGFLRAFYDEIKINNEAEALRFLTLSSWFHGLSTTLGQSYFESVAHILSCGEKRSFSDYKVSTAVGRAITNIITNLKDGKMKPNLHMEICTLKAALRENGPAENGLNFTADVYIEDADSVTMIELKSVRPNSGEMRGEKQKILYGLAHLMNEKKNKKVRFYLGFPFDPTASSDNPCGYDKKRFSQSLVEFKKFFSEDEFLIASELWDFLSGKPNTMCQLLKIIDSIAQPDFEAKFQTINTFTFIDSTNLYGLRAINTSRFNDYISILEQWYLYSEIDLAEKVAEVATGNGSVSLIKNKRKRKRFETLIHQPMFKEQGSNIRYNNKRKEDLLKLIGG